MRLLAARADGALKTVEGATPAGRSGRRLLAFDADELLPLPEAATLAHLPGRRVVTADGKLLGSQWMPVAAILPVGYLRTLLPATRPQGGAPRLPLFGYTAAVEHDGEIMAAALRSDDFAWWRPELREGANVAAAVAAARDALPGSRLVEHLSRCALEYRCYTAENTFLRRYEGALPASPACNADCLGCISLQTDAAVPSPQERMAFAPTPDELADLAGYHLDGAEAPMVSFGQGCEGEALTRGQPLVEATRRIHERHPEATIHINSNGSRPEVLERLIEAGCSSIRISAISFRDEVFRPYYRPVGYGLPEVLACGRLMQQAGGQVCLNLLTFPGITDVPEEMEQTISACQEMGVHQVQWRTLNVDHDWLADLLPPMADGIGLGAAMAVARRRLPGVEHGNFTRPWPRPRTSV